MKVYHRILQDWKVLKCDFRFWNVLEIYDIKLIVMERFSYDLEMKMCEQKKTTNQQKQSDLIGLSNGHKLSWLLVGQANAWVKKLHARELSRNQSNFALTSYCNTIGQSNNTFSIQLNLP